MTKKVWFMAVVLVVVLAGYVWAADFGTPAEARAMLEKATVELKKDKAKALEMFTKGGKVDSRTAISIRTAEAPTAISPPTRALWERA